jgi:hypothetical protein
MFSKYQTNFYIRKDAPDLLWAGLSINIPNKEYNSYKLSSFIAKQKNDEWKAEQIDLMIFDNQNNMYRINKYHLSDLYNSGAQDKSISYTANLSRPEDKYLNIEIVNIYLNEQLIKNLIDEFLTKSEQSFGVKISI